MNKEHSERFSFSNYVKTSKMLFVYPACFNSQKTKAFLNVLKNPSTPCALAQSS